MKSFLLVKEATRSRVPLQYNVVSFSLGQEIAHLQASRSSSKHAVVMVLGAVTVEVIKGGEDKANQREEDETWKAGLHPCRHE